MTDKLAQLAAATPAVKAAAKELGIAPEQTYLCAICATYADHPTHLHPKDDTSWPN